MHPPPSLLHQWDPCCSLHSPSTWSCISPEPPRHLLPEPDEAHVHLGMGGLDRLPGGVMDSQGRAPAQLSLLSSPAWHGCQGKNRTDLRPRCRNQKHWVPSIPGCIEQQRGERCGFSGEGPRTHETLAQNQSLQDAGSCTFPPRLRCLPFTHLKTLDPVLHL